MRLLLVPFVDKPWLTALKAKHRLLGAATLHDQGREGRAIPCEQVETGITGAAAELDDIDLGRERIDADVVEFGGR